MRWRILVSLLSLTIVGFGVGYAVGRERLRDPDHLHALYQETNKQFFGGQLCDAEVKSHDLSDAYAAGVTYQEMPDRFVIVLDPKWNTSENEALRTMRHEACHVATWDVMDPNDVHGPPFQECMKRFAEKE
jgi:predicted SprT family Zn-dependent metalloprotease